MYFVSVQVAKKQPYKTDNSSKQIQKINNSTNMEIKTLCDLLIVLIITVSAVSAGIPGSLANNSKDTDSQYVREYLYQTNNSETWLNICVDKISVHAINLVCGEVQRYIRTNLTNKSDYLSSESVMLLCKGYETNSKECKVEKISSCSNILYNATCVSCTETRETPPPPCSSNQTCHNQTGTCKCQTPFYGNSCQFLGMDCTAECLNGGTCNFVDATCICPNGYEGGRCEQRICVPACRNGGVCLPRNQCQCSNGTYGELCENIDIFQYKLMIGLPLAAIAFFICLLSCMLVLLIIQCRKLMKYKCIDISLCKKKKMRKEKREVGRKDYENVEELLRKTQIPLTYVPNQGRISEALYDTLEVIRDVDHTTSSKTGYTTMQLRYGYENAEMVFKQELERRNAEANAGRPSYIFLN